MKKEKEHKYLVLKWEDINEYLTQDQRKQLTKIINFISLSREMDGKKSQKKHKYIICNQDEPYAEDVWQLILKGEDDELKQKIKESDV